LWQRGRQVHWALYRQDGSFTGEQGQAGETPGGHLATAFTGPDDDFYLVF
jgi:hypothetical protein